MRLTRSILNKKRQLLLSSECCIIFPDENHTECSASREFRFSLKLAILRLSRVKTNNTILMNAKCSGLPQVRNFMILTSNSWFSFKSCVGNRIKIVDSRRSIQLNAELFTWVSTVIRGRSMDRRKHRPI